MPRKAYTLLGAALALCGGIAGAAEVAVTVLDRDGLPVPDVAVYVERDEPHLAAPIGQRVVMDQVDTRFVPHLLVVQKGTHIEFPNSDTIAHHVYSFSDPNDFMLPLYKGEAHPPVMLEHPGIVTLGCNIHDGMLAYILVVDGPVFGKTDAMGRMMLVTDSSPGQRVRIWSPRIRSRGETLTQEISGAEVTFRLRSALRPAHDAENGGVDWSDY